MGNSNELYRPVTDTHGRFPVTCSQWLTNVAPYVSNRCGRRAVVLAPEIEARMDGKPLVMWRGMCDRCLVEDLRRHLRETEEREGRWE